MNMKELMKQILVCEEADLSAEDSGFTCDFTEFMRSLMIVVITVR